jgi:transposase
MLGMLNDNEVEILLKAGHAKAEIARMSGVSLRSVHRIAEEGPVVQIEDEAERRKGRIGRPSTVQNFRKQVVNVLEQEPDLATLEILRRAREDMKAARRHCTRGWPRCDLSPPSRCGLRGCRESSVNTTLGKCK